MTQFSTLYEMASFFKVTSMEEEQYRFPCPSANSVLCNQTSLCDSEKAQHFRQWKSADLYSFFWRALNSFGLKNSEMQTLIIYSFELH